MAPADWPALKAPDCRGQGLLERMIEQVAAWAAGQGAGLLRPR